MKKSKLTLWTKGLLLALIFAAAACDKEEQAQIVTDEFSSLSNKGTTAVSSGLVVFTGGQWRATVNGVVKYLGSGYIEAINAAIGGLTAGRTTKEWVTVENSGSSGESGGALKHVTLQSYTGIDFNNATFNCNSSDLFIVPVFADRKTNVEVKNLKVTGTPRYGIWFRGCTNMVISNINMNISTTAAGLGLGVRVDDSTAPTSNLTMNGTLTFVGGDMHIETGGLDGFNIGNVTTSNNRGCGVLLNGSKNGTVGTVTGNYNCNGGGYATFRVANNNGPNITCAKVYSRNSGRGFFSVSGSNGTTVNTVDIANSTNQCILLENASNTKVKGGTVSGGNPNVRHVNATSCSTIVNGQTYTAVNGIW